MVDADVVVIGSGFGGAVAALRFAQAGHRVLVLERGARVARDAFQADLDALWLPRRGAYGFHELRGRGRQVVPWVGAAVGGGSHVYAGTLLRSEVWDGWPRAIRQDDLRPWYEAAERMLGATPYPDWPPYAEVRATRLMFRAGRRLQAAEPDLVEGWGPLPLGISFAPRDGPGRPGQPFVNAHGCPQRYADPAEQSLLGGDIGAKNSLDRNYLFLAERAGATIAPLCEADRLERLADGRWRVEFRRHLPPRGWARLRLRWLTWRPAAPMSGVEAVVARRVVVACGAVGSTELLLRNRDLHRTLPALGPALGRRYTTNGDFLALLVHFPLLVPTWLGFAALAAGALLGWWPLAALGAAAYYGGLLASGPPDEPDLGTTNSDYLRFRGPAGEPQHAYVEGGRYPTPGRWLVAILVSAATGRFRPSTWPAVAALARAVSFLVPPLGALARCAPIPLLEMGRDRAYGTFSLDAGGRATLDYDLAANRDFYARLDALGRKIARAAGAWWLPNPVFRLLGKQEVPHNQGGVPMADGPGDGVVDHAGRVFGEPDLVVLDGSILPESVGPNPALTIAAVAERAMAVILRQIEGGGAVRAEPPEAPGTAAR